VSRRGRTNDALDGVIHRIEFPAAIRPDPKAADQGPPSPVLSICVPTFNRPELVKRAIASVIESASGAEADVEIVVSDNSPDVSEEACLEELRRWRGGSLYVGNRLNVGIPANFNESIARATGRYVLFVCDDDRLLPGAVRAILDALADEEDAALLFQVDAVDPSGRVLRRQNFGDDARLGPTRALGRLLADNRFALFPGVVVRRDAYAVVGPFDGSVGNATDIEMWVRVFSRYGVRCLPTTISAYTVHAGSATQSTPFDAQAVTQLIEIFDRARATGLLPVSTIDRYETDYIHSIILSHAFLDLRAGDPAAAREKMALFELPSVRALGLSKGWFPVRLAFSILVRCPSALVRMPMNFVDRFVLVRRTDQARVA